jgi:hypothetical protein
MVFLKLGEICLCVILMLPLSILLPDLLPFAIAAAINWENIGRIIFGVKYANVERKLVAW